MRPLLPLLLLAAGCAAPRTVELPPMPPGMAADTPRFVESASVSFVAPPAPAHTLFWEHDRLRTPGFTVERTEDFQTWQQIGFVSVTNTYRINANVATYQFPLTDEPSDKAFYRVGATEFSP